MSDFKIQGIHLLDTGVPGRGAKSDATVAPSPGRKFAGSSEQVRDITALKQDLARMSTSLRESMRLNQDSVGEIEKFARFLKIAEVNTISLERLQPENQDLKAKLEDVRTELSKKKLWANELESKSLAYKARFEETHAELESSQSKLSSLGETLNEERIRFADVNDALDKLQEERRELRSMVSDLQTENSVLQDSITRLTESENELLRSKTELVKKSEVLSAKIDDERRDREVALSDLKGLRLDYSEMKASHMETLSKLDKAVHNAQSNEHALIDFRQRSEDRIFALTSAIDGMKAQQKINEDMTRYDEQEKAKLKVEAELEHRRVKDLQAKLDIRAKEQEEGHAALSRAKANYDLLNTKYLSLLADMETLRTEHKRQSQKLEEYSSISGVAVGQSFYDDGKSGKTGKSSKKADSPKLKLVKDAPKT